MAQHTVADTLLDAFSECAGGEQPRRLLPMAFGVAFLEVGVAELKHSNYLKALSVYLFNSISVCSPG